MGYKYFRCEWLREEPKNKAKQEMIKELLDQ